MKGIFDTSPVAKYDDFITRRYHFPKRYLGKAKKTEGDWIIYREPSSDRNGYVAAAQVTSITVDPVKAGHYYANVSNFLPFNEVVPFHRNGGSYWEKWLNSQVTSRVGIAMRGNSIRNISDVEFNAIVYAGLQDTLNPEYAVRFDLVNDEQAYKYVTLPPHQKERLIVEMIVNRKIRAASFRRDVLTAYDNRCAVTGIRIINGHGKAEAQAAHILPVANNGPDVVQNGIALSATAHWLFDRHLISLNDDFGLLLAPKKVPEQLKDLISPQMKRILLPKNKTLWPHLPYIQRRRKEFAR